MSRDLGVACDGEAPETSPGRPVAVVQLIATAALAASTLIAVTAVSIGIARADVLGAHAESGSASVAIAVFVGLLLTGMGGLTALMANRRD
jgi:hypothetical protein